ncbi:MAG: inner membrane protein [Patiriisocius sp.]|jgi:inner membrane protein
MDPITQGALGAVLPQSTVRSADFRQKALTISWVGCLAGLAPDLDVLIRSSTDPLLFLEYHRQFTHALIFIPFGALICAAVFHRWARIHLSFAMTYLVSILGFATHALLDACTTYGTQLFWPFADTRVAWNTIAVVDPLATLPLLALVITSAIRSNQWYARVGLLWFLCYLMAGWIQRDRANESAQVLAESRGHQGAIISTKPGFANLLLWKSVYEFDDRYYVDAIRVGLTPTHYSGANIPKLDLKRDLAWLKPSSQQAIDLKRFRWFSMGYLALDPDREDFVIDMRYSVLPNEIKPLWGIGLSKLADDSDHVTFETFRDASPARLSRLWAMIMGETCIPDSSKRDSINSTCDP